MTMLFWILGIGVILVVGLACLIGLPMFLLWILAISACLPYLMLDLLQHVTGYFFQKTCKVGERTILRSDQFKTRHQKKAFQEIARYIESPMSRDEMLVYQDAYLKNDKFSNKIPLEVWREVLEWFANEGVIVERWELKIPMDLKQPSYYSGPESWDPYREGWLKTPFHGPNGEILERSNDSGSGDTPFNPGLLSLEQKIVLIGETYKIYDNGRTDDPNEEIIIEERNFRQLYYRPSEMVSQEAKKRLADKMSIVVPLVHAARRN